RRCDGSGALFVALAATAPSAAAPAAPAATAGGFAFGGLLLLGSDGLLELGRGGSLLLLGRWRLLLIVAAGAGRALIAAVLLLLGLLRLRLAAAVLCPGASGAAVRLDLGRGAAVVAATGALLVVSSFLARRLGFGLVTHEQAAQALEEGRQAGAGARRRRRLRLLLLHVLRSGRGRGDPLDRRLLGLGPLLEQRLGNRVRQGRGGGQLVADLVGAVIVLADALD